MHNIDSVRCVHAVQRNNLAATTNNIVHHHKITIPGIVLDAVLTILFLCKVKHLFLTSVFSRRVDCLKNLNVKFEKSIVMYYYFHISVVN